MIKEFISYQRNVKGLSPRTCEEYSKNLSYFIAWAQPRKLRWSTIMKSDIDSWTMDMMLMGVKPATIRQRISVIRSCFGWMVNEGMLHLNPARYCQSPKTTKALPTAVDITKIDAYLETPAYTPQQQELHIAVALMIETGCRLHEVMMMRTQDFNKQTSSVRVSGKGSKERIVYYGARCKQQLNSYKRHSTGKLITTMDDTTLRFEMYRELGKFCPHVHPHQLRHTFATEMLNNGMDLKTLSVLLGHESVKTTEIYARASEQRIHNQYSQFKF